MMEATSPTDRIEQLLNKYKARYNLSSAASGSSNSSTPVFTPCKHETLSWHDINKQLRSRGFVEVMFTSASKAEENGAAVVMDEVSIQSIKATINALLEDFDRKQNLIQQLLNDSSKENEQLKLMKEETGQSRNQLDNLQKQLSTQIAKYKELEEVHFMSLKDHGQQLDSFKKDQAKAVTTCQELQAKCINQEAEINHLKNQVGTLKFNLDAHMSDTVSASSLHSSPVKKTVVPYHDQQLENDFQVLQTQINNLKYKNIKLQLDLQNRPERQELRQSQKQVKQLEQELIQCKKLLSSEQREIHHAHKHLESICVLLDVKDMDHVIPCLQQYQVMLKAMKDMEKCLVTVVDLMAHPNSPAVQHSPTPQRGHMNWCHYSWDHVIPTLKQWLKELNGLKELYAVFADVCNSLKLKGPKHDISETFEYSSLSCKQMSVLLRQWLMKEHNRKVAQQQALVTMVTHYQRMFGVKWIGGVYASMSHVAMTLEETQNILKNIKEILHLDHSASGRQLVAMVEQLASNHDDTSLMAQIVEQVGLTTPVEVVERLKLCQRFFPAFQQVISEVQELLGVHSLGAISPALHELQRKTMK